MEIMIRLATAADGEEVHRLNRDVLGYDYPLAETLARLALILQKPNARVFIAEAGGRVAGYLHAADYDCTYASSMKNILSLAVDPAFRRKGIGRRLLAAMEAWAREDGAYGVRLVSGIDRMDAHAFYLAAGYHMRKEQKNFVKRVDG